MQQFLDKADVTRIKAEHQRYLDAGEVVTMPLHQRILETWKRDSPKMYLRLRTQGVLEAMAFNCQQRMWAECDLLEKSGMPPTDAREQAEREHLMLEPETDPDEQEQVLSPLALIQQALDEAHQIPR